MRIPNVNQVYMMLAMFFALGVVLGDFPEISRSWWSNLKSFLNTNLTNIINSLNTAIQSSEKGTANGVATLGADGKIPDAQIPNLAIIDIITSAEATLAGYIANEWSAGSIQKGDAVQITLADGTVEIWQLFQNDGDEEADYKKIDASKVDWDNVLNKPSTIDALAGVKVYRALLTQSSTNAPVATVLENSLGGEVVWTRQDTGTYHGTLIGKFLENKTFVRAGNGSNNFDPDTGFTPFISIKRFSDDVILIVTGDSSDFADGFLKDEPIEIIVYP